MPFDFTLVCSLVEFDFETLGYVCGCLSKCDRGGVSLSFDFLLAADFVPRSGSVFGKLAEGESPPGVFVIVVVVVVVVEDERFSLVENILQLTGPLHWMKMPN